MISRFARVWWTVGTETAWIFKRRSPSINSFPVAPPENPIHVGFAPKACSAMATCAALPPGVRWTSDARFTRPTRNSANTRRVSMAGFKLTQKNKASRRGESGSSLFIGGILFGPRRCMSQARVDGLNVSHTVSFEPFFKRFRSAPDKNAHAVLPGGASAEYTAKMHTGFRGKLQSFIECAIAHACGEKQERFRGCLCRAAKKIKSISAGVYERAVRGRRTLHVGHGHGDSHFQNIYAIPRLREFLHGARQDIRLTARKFRTLFLHPSLIRNNFKEKGGIHTRAFPADSLHPCELAIHDFRRIRQGIVQQDLDAVGTSLDQPAHGPAFQQPWEAARNVSIVATDFVGHQKP